MFCFQCEQTSKGTGCTTVGTCGKSDETACLQDLLVHAAKGIAQYAARAARLGASVRKFDQFILEALFVTVTNVNFDDLAIEKVIRRASEMRDVAKDLYETSAKKAGVTPEVIKGPAAWIPAQDLAGLARQGTMVSVLFGRDQFGADVSGLQELLVYGLKGAAAYADHALVLGHESENAYAFFRDALCYLADGDLSVDGLLGFCLRCGEVNLGVMELLDGAHTGAYGHPVPTPVRIEPLKGKAILVSGHDLKDLEKLLIQTQGKGINIYTHGEMLPGHGYPKLKAYPHLVGNYGGAWQDQKVEFAKFPGAILMTTNCIQEPQESYNGRIDGLVLGGK